MRLQRVQVVVDLLPSQADPRGRRRRRGAPHGLQGHCRRRRIIDNFDVEHGEMVALTTIVVKQIQGFAAEFL
jgi:hypothetical protein